MNIASNGYENRAVLKSHLQGHLATQNAVWSRRGEWADNASPVVHGMISRLSSLRRDPTLVSKGAAFLTYQALSLAFFGFPALCDFSHLYVGWFTDPTFYSWSLVWWPYALRHGLNPFITSHAASYNLTWTTAMPAPSVLAYPLTWAFGPIVSQNVLCLMAPALAAWAAYVLCLYLSKSVWPSLLGGYVFGFSPYFAGQLLGHLPLLLVFPVPLALYLTLRRFDGSISAHCFVFLQALLISLFALTWIEGLATATLFAGMMLLVASIVLRSESRRRLWYVTLQTGGAYVLAAIILSPLFYYTFAYGLPSQPLNSPETYSADLLGFFVPTRISMLGQLRLFQSIANRLAGGNLSEMTAYVPLGLVVGVILFAASRWKEPCTRILTYSLLLVLLASLGPRLQICGKALFGLPWAMFLRIPTINNALPGRFTMYSFLCLATMTSIYLSTLRSRRVGVLLAMLVVITSLPNVWFVNWCSTPLIPAFFSQWRYRKYIHQGETVLILPFGLNSYEMLWQALSNMYFRSADGPWPPPEYQQWPILGSFFTGDLPIDAETQLACFLTSHQVSEVLVESDKAAIGRAVMSSLQLDPVEDGGVLVYRLPQTLIMRFSARTCRHISTRLALISISKYIDAANRFWNSGEPIRKLTPWEVERLGFLNLSTKAALGDQGSPSRQDRVWLGPWGGCCIGVGLLGTYQDLRPAIDLYKSEAVDVFFPYPAKLDRPAGDTVGQLLLTFTKEGLNRAVAKSVAVKDELARLRSE